jgi:hypothetical protein
LKTTGIPDYINNEKKGGYSMIRGTAQPFKFKIPYNFSELSTVSITFWQENYNGIDATRPLPIIKELNQCRQGSSPKELIVILNKEETLRFTDERKAYVQIMAEVTGGLPFGNKPAMITVYPVYDDSNNIIPAPGPDDGDGIIILDGSTII